MTPRYRARQRPGQGLRGRTGDDAIASEFEWLVGSFREIDRRTHRTAVYDAKRISTWLEAGAIHGLEDAIRTEEALRSVVIAAPDGRDINRADPRPS